MFSWFTNVTPHAEFWMTPVHLAKLSCVLGIWWLMSLRKMLEQAEIVPKIQLGSGIRPYPKSGEVQLAWWVSKDRCSGDFWSSRLTFGFWFPTWFLLWASSFRSIGWCIFDPFDPFQYILGSILKDIWFSVSLQTGTFGTRGLFLLS